MKSNMIHAVVASLLLVELVNGFVWQNGAEGVKWQFNCDFVANPGSVSDFKSIPNSRGEDCGQNCVSYANHCNAFAYAHGTCYLKLRRSTGGSVVPQAASGVTCGYLPYRSIS